MERAKPQDFGLTPTNQTVLKFDTPMCMSLD